MGHPSPHSSSANTRCPAQMPLSQSSSLVSRMAHNLIRKLAPRGGHGETEERRITADEYITVLMSMGTYLGHLSWVLPDKFPVPTCQTLKVPIQVLTGFSHVHRPDGLKAASLGQLWAQGRKGRGGSGSLHLPGSSSPTGGHVFSMTSPTSCNI